MDDKYKDIGFDEFEEEIEVKMNYLSTNLNYKPNIYLNDVEVEDVSHHTISQKK
jgi:hypothetical protein